MRTVVNRSRGTDDIVNRQVRCRRADCDIYDSTDHRPAFAMPGLWAARAHVMHRSGRATVPQSRLIVMAFRAPGGIRESWARLQEGL